MPSTARRLTITLSDEEFTLLRELNFPCTEHLFKGVRRTKHGRSVSGTRRDFEDLVGWVAGEANHSRAGSDRFFMLNEIADQIEDLLAFNRSS